MSFETSYQDFLFQLRDNYGFIIPVDRLRDCLVCSKNICDVEEVCFRTQSLVCTSQEQVDIFQSVFAQTFLNKRPIPPAGITPKSSKGKKPKEYTWQELQQRSSMFKNKQRSLERDLDRLREEEEKIAEFAKATETEKNRITQDYINAKRAVEDINQEVRAAAKAASPNPENAALQKKCRALTDMLKGMGQEPIAGKIENALASPDYSKGLDECIRDILAAAGGRRASGDAKEYQQLLSVVPDVEALKKLAAKAVDKETKQVLFSVKKKAAAQKKELSALEDDVQKAEMSHQQREYAQRRQAQEIRRKQRNLLDVQNNIEETERQAAKMAAAQSGDGDTLSKEQAQRHRAEFLSGILSVQTTRQIAELMETNLNSMPTDDKNRILTYIRTNAREFRHTLRRLAGTPQHRKVDIKATVRAANRTAGEPFVIKYKKPHKSHAKVMLLTDISGSCRSASTLALYFMALMGEAFPGGCKKFVFVNSLVPVDKYFANRTADEGVECVLKTVPNRGIYSDYGETIRMLRDEYAGLFHKDTTVIILGDARNNRRASHAEDLKYIADRCHRVFWLNTDDKRKWNQGDSIIGEYEKSGAKAYAVRTAGDLIDFLSSISLSHAPI